MTFRTAWKSSKFLGQAGTVPYFIGLNDVARNGTWIWDQPTGQTLTVFLQLETF